MIYWIDEYGIVSRIRNGFGMFDENKGSYERLYDW